MWPFSGLVYYSATQLYYTLFVMTSAKNEVHTTFSPHFIAPLYATCWVRAEYYIWYTYKQNCNSSNTIAILENFTILVLSSLLKDKNTYSEIPKETRDSERLAAASGDSQWRIFVIQEKSGVSNIQSAFGKCFLLIKKIFLICILMSCCNSQALLSLPLIFSLHGYRVAIRQHVLQKNIERPVSLVGDTKK